MKRPENGEYFEYYSTYVNRVPDRPLGEVLAEAPDALEAVLSSVSPDQEDWAYAPDKWTIRDVVGHVIDTERLFSYRALHIARGDPAELPGMDQDDWARDSNASQRALSDLLTEFRGLRAANTAMFSSFDDARLSRRGVASGYKFSLRSLAFIVAGHEIHHRDVLAKRYVAALESTGAVNA